MSVLADLAQRLVDQGVGTLWNGTTGNIVRGHRINEPGDECLFLNTYPGDASRIRGDNYRAVDERFNVQVLARAQKRNQKAAEDLAESAWDKIQFRHATINAREYAHCRAPQKPAYVGIDENHRPLVMFNLEVRRHRGSGL